jgi:hypothetical protein
MFDNGSLKSLRLFWTILAKNHRYRDLVSDKDIESFERRSQNEGITFLTTTLPKIGKALDAFHATTVWTAPEQFNCDGDGIPIFLGLPIRLALDGNSLAVELIRQLTFLFYKLEVDYDLATRERYLDQFVTTDADLARSYDPRDNNEVKGHVATMRRIIARILCNTNPKDIRPCHGSGATACRTANSDKWHELRYYPKLDATYCYADYFFYSHTHLADELQKLEDSPESVPMARVVLVPKDSRGPRIISCEPAELMFIQQGIMNLLYEVLENHTMTRGQLNFTDQSINQRLAHEGSVSDSWATIDLTDASDRVSLRLVRDVFSPLWFECLTACRSESTLLPDGRIVELNKFAPMGSSCCFPVEALVFWASAQATIHRLGFKHPSYVYGDDIIVAKEFSEAIMNDLELIGLKVNRQKSFTKGPFRESCGGEYHSGSDVTPIKIRSVFGKSSTCVASGADLCNFLIARFGYEDAKPLIDLIEKENSYVYPRTELDIPNSIRYGTCASNDAFFKRRWNKSLQRFEHRVLLISTDSLELRPPTWSELLRKELSTGHYSDTAVSPRWVKPQRHSDPGMYAVDHSARCKWSWVWLG